MGFVMAHPTGNANVRQVAMALHEIGALREYLTSVNPTRLTSLAGLPPRMRQALARRAVPPEISHLTKARPVMEIRRGVGRRVGALAVSDHDFYAHFDELAARRLRDGDSVYAYEDAGLKTLRRATSLGSTRIYELPMGFHRAALDILRAEAERSPSWAATMPGLSTASAVSARKDEELDLAEVIVVPSSFAGTTVPTELQGRVQVALYGGPAAVDRPRLNPGRGPLKVLFVGGMTQRKGLSYLFDGIRRSGARAQVTVVGRPYAECRALSRALEGVGYFPSLPHARILDLMHHADVLVFPTLFDGHGLVISEALSQGCPVIASRSSAGPDLIVPGRNGFLVNAGDADAIASALDAMDGDRDLVNSMKANALDSVRPWSGYRARIQDIARAAAGGTSS